MVRNAGARIAARMNPCERLISLMALVLTFGLAAVV